MTKIVNGSHRRKGHPKAGGRQKGTKNRVTREIGEAARVYSVEALKVLVAIMRNKDGSEQVKVAAVREILDRGHGRPAQAVALTGKDGEALPTRVISVVLSADLA